MPYRIVDPKAFKVFKHLCAAALDDRAGTEEERRSKAVEALRRLPALSAATGLALLTDGASPPETPPPGVSPMPAAVAASLTSPCTCGHLLGNHTLAPPHPCGLHCPCAGFATDPPYDPWQGAPTDAPDPNSLEKCDRCHHAQYIHGQGGLGGSGCGLCGCPRFYPRGTAARARGETPARDWRDDLEGPLGTPHRPPPGPVRVVETPRPGGTAEMWDDTAFGRTARKKF